MGGGARLLTTLVHTSAGRELCLECSVEGSNPTLGSSFIIPKRVVLDSVVLLRGLMYVVEVCVLLCYGCLLLQIMVPKHSMCT